MANIAVFSVNIDVQYTVEIMKGINDEAKARGIGLSVFNANITENASKTTLDAQFNIYKLANFSYFDGVIIFSNLLQGSSAYRYLKEKVDNLDIPVVSLDAAMGRHYSVGVENYKSMKKMVNHFIEEHHFSSIDYVSGPFQSADSQLRLAAYCDALKEHGIPVEQKRIFPGNFNPQHGAAIANKLINSGKELPEAIVCANDAIAIGMCKVFKENNIKVPEDVCISGFDNTYASQNFVPSISTVDRSLPDVGKRAVEKICAHIEGKQQEITDVFPSTPVYRDSCGCSRTDVQEDEDVRKRFVKTVDYYNRHLTECNMMVQDLNDSKTLNDFMIRLLPYVQSLGRKKVVICLNKEFVDELKQDSEVGSEEYGVMEDGYSETMHVLLAYEDGMMRIYDDFPSEQMLPWDIRENPEYMVFSPIHFQNKYYGYLAIYKDEYDSFNALVRTWVFNLNSGIENLYKQMRMKNVLDRLDGLYVKDSLTGLYNRFGFSRYAKDSFDECRRKKKNAMIFFADLDGLKVINDRYGHDKGDVAIITLARALKNCSTRDEVCARFGGDEFIVYAENSSEELCRDFCERFVKELARLNAEANEEFTIDASYGYNLFVPGENDNIEMFIDDADAKMYKQKREKKAERSN